jgi:hypothetical protein
MTHTFEKQLPFVRCQIRRAATTGDPLLVHRRDDFIEREIRLPTNQRRQKRRVRFQRRDAAVARLGSDAPVACRRCINLIAELELTSNQSAASCRDSPDSTASTTRSRNSKEHGFAIDPLSKPESMPARFNYPSLPEFGPCSTSSPKKLPSVTPTQASVANARNRLLTQQPRMIFSRWNSGGCLLPTDMKLQNG